MRRRIGVDVGGTNTEGVVIEDGKVIAAHKTPTTEDVLSGVREALSAVAVPDVQGVMIGTTHFVNAVVQRRDLPRVGALRIGMPASRSLPPFCDWPEDLATLVRGAVHMVEGGVDYDGRPIMPLDQRAIAAAARQMRAAGLSCAAVSSIFSPLDPAMEERAAQILRQEMPGATVTLSHELGRIGLLERENVALLNAALIPLAAHRVQAFEQAVAAAGIAAPLYITQNDGTVIRAELAARFPVLSFASGPTNSIRGAAFLTGVQDALVVDVGGISEVLRPANAAVANAVGAAIAQVSGEADQVFHGLSRSEAMAEAERIARARAVDAGADPASLSLVDIEDLPLAYMPGGALRVRARVVGNIREAP
ncbi:MAG: hypothetical protein N2Z67_11355 [Acetobacteraceae bacterium]|nr:hypothetical protein [Acetobacteraceae bacterium]